MHRQQEHHHLGVGLSRNDERRSKKVSTSGRILERVAEIWGRREDGQTEDGKTRGQENGKEAEVFHVGVEKRRLKPFVQLPVQRSSKQFVDQFKEHFAGFRIDRQEYRSDYKGL